MADPEGSDWARPLSRDYRPFDAIRLGLIRKWWSSQYFEATPESPNIAYETGF